MFSQTSEYALRAVALLAQNYPEPLKTSQISQRARITKPYLVKVLQALARANMVATRRGVGGGVSLIKPPDEVTILDVVNAVDPIQRIDACPIGLASHGVRLCPMHSRLDEAIATMEQTLRRTTLAEVAGQPAPRTCRFPGVVSEGQRISAT